MRGYRAERLAELIHQEVARRLREDIKDARLVPVSITHVQVQRDLKRATLHFMPLGGGEVGSGLQDALDGAAKQLRGPVGRALRVRHSPELVFVPDAHTEQAVRLTSLLSRIGDDLRERDEEGEE